MRLHVITPALNEAENLRSLLPVLLSGLPPGSQITIADGGSTDDTAKVLSQFPTVNHLHCNRCGRAQQMNEAARLNQDRFDAVYFIHADTRPPEGFYEDIKKAISEGYPVGCYRFKFDMWHPLLWINAYCTRFNGLACRGGDQSLYLSMQTFQELEGFRDMRIMEDYDIIERIWEKGIPFRVIPRSVTVSARKYRANGWYKVQMANLKVFRMYKAGAPEEEMISRYRTMLKPW
ncbi:glycosyltransferase [Neolewinella aurantiaca]|uniref:Glycosyltransferase n=1 Tax=Neolewinella aurantiaca TaxID=2602767 RepID=A0A5C7FY32_9BACT|nr:glycosyltransferase [Neolewinella aurantiaca]TXF89940.1 glycosyltransferase [Neolewinella aurantiaca]